MTDTKKRGRPKTPVIKVKKLQEEAKIPEMATLEAAGFDLAAYGDYVIPSNDRMMIKTGIALEIPPGYEGQVRPRSGLAFKQGVTVLNAPGTIDADYRGEVGVILFNTGPELLIKHGDRVAQLLIQKVPKVKFELAEELSDTDRGAGGFGSTGR